MSNTGKKTFLFGSTLVIAVSFIASLGFGSFAMATTTIGTDITTNDLTISGSLQLPSGASNNYILVSDAGGNASWIAVSSALSNATTDNLIQGSTNLYYDPADVNTRADARITLQKGAVNGLAELDSDGKVPSGQLPSLVITNVYPVANITARNLLTVQTGDVAVVDDAGSGESRSYIYDGTIWLELKSPTALSLIAASNLSDLGSVSSARTNLGLGTADSPTFAGLTLTAPLSVGNGGTGLASYSANNLLYASGTSTIAGVATTANGVLLTDLSGVPSIGTTLPTQVQTNITRLGTITNGTWNGTEIAVLNGGTGATSASGARTNLGIDGVLIGTQVLTSTSLATYTPTSGTKAIVVELIGAGGGGGGASGTSAGNFAAAAGGGGGAYTRVYITSVSSSYSYQAGTGGAGGTGSAGSTGTNGSTTTFGSYAADGGDGGQGQSAGSSAQGSLGGLGGTSASSGSIKAAGQPGNWGIRLSGTAGMGGNGGSSVLGGGALATGTVRTGGDYGGGGAGGSTSDATSVSGGTGANGIIIVTEYK